MKYIFKHSVYLVALLTLLLSCEDDERKMDVGFEIEKNEITAANVGLTEFFKITAPGRWSASSEDAWIKINPVNGNGTANCEITIDASVSNQSRQGVLTISSESGEVKRLAITQFGFNKEIILSTSDTVINSSAVKELRYVNIGVTSNVDLKHTIITIPEEGELSTKATWIKCTNASDFDPSETGARPQYMDLRFEWESNLQAKERAVEVLFTSEELADTVTLSIRQQAGPLITDDAVGDSLVLCIVSEKINTNVKWNTSERLEYWNGVVLWQKTDSIVKEHPEMLGRVRELTIKSIRTKEAIPAEIGNLKYLESLWIGSNASTLLLDIDLSKAEDGIGNLEHLKSLTIFAYGLVGNLPRSWSNLKKLEILDLRSNNFSSIPSMLTKVNFPALKYLDLSANKRYATTTLYPMQYPANKIGLYLNVSSVSFKNILKWEELEFIGFSNCVLEGKIPTASSIGISKVYTESDFEGKGDTLSYAVGKPKVLPNTKILRLNLNFLTGDIPDWILYHPKLQYWNPWILVFKQEGGKKNTAGELVGFDNAPSNWDYYWEKYPLLKPQID